MNKKDPANNITIRLNSAEDNYKNKYFIANKLTNFSLDLRKGYVFFIFLSEDGLEELQIGNLDGKTEKTSVVTKSTESKLKFRIYERTDAYGKKYFLGKIRMNATLSLNSEDSSFLIFTSIPGKEELQIVGSIINHD